MSATAPTDTDRAVEFTAAVRAHLTDLPSDEVDELLDGLQADLADRLADEGELGDPLAYAEELRQAAGLPPRAENQLRPRRGLRTRARDQWIAAAERTHRFWGATPGRRGVRDFVVSLRPLWWVVRGLVVSWVLLAPSGRGIGQSIDLIAVVVACAAILLSAQWGRGLWAPNRWLVALRRTVNALAVLLVLPALMVTANQMAAPSYAETMDDPWYPLGLVKNGEQIENIFAFDCTGQPIAGVQLFDQNGQPITTLQGEASEGAEPAFGWDEKTQSNRYYLRSEFATMPSSWNVFPMSEALIGLSEDQASAERKAKPAKFPFVEVPSLGSGCPVEAGEADGADGAATNGAEAGTEPGGAADEETTGSDSARGSGAELADADADADAGASARGEG